MKPLKASQTMDYAMTHLASDTRTANFSLSLAFGCGAGRTENGKSTLLEARGHVSAEAFATKDMSTRIDARD